MSLALSECCNNYKINFKITLRQQNTSSFFFFSFFRCTQCLEVVQNSSITEILGVFDKFCQHSNLQLYLLQCKYRSRGKEKRWANSESSLKVLTHCETFSMTISRLSYFWGWNVPSSIGTAFCWLSFELNKHKLKVKMSMKSIAIKNDKHFS